jgi:hypothetical protein
MLKTAALLFISSLSAGAQPMHRSDTIAVSAHATVTAAAPNLSGTYLLDRKHSDDPSHALDDATESMRRFRRNAVRKKLGEALKPADTLRIAVSGDTVALATSGRLHLTTIPGAEAKSREGEKGGSIQVASTWVGDTLVVKTTSERFQREARYSLDSGGASLRVAITMSGSASNEPIHYALVYQRLSGASEGT